MAQGYLTKSAGILILTAIFFSIGITPSSAVDCGYDCTQKQNQCVVSDPNSCNAAETACQNQSQYYNSDCRTQFDACYTQCQNLTKQCEQQCEQQKAQEQSTPAPEPAQAPTNETTPVSPAPAQPAAETQQNQKANATPMIIRVESLQPGQTVKTGAGQHITLTFSDGSGVDLGPNSSFTASEKKHPNDITVSGKIHLFFEKLRKIGNEQQTRNMIGTTAVVAVRGTEFLMSETNGLTTVQVLEGSVVVSDKRGKKKAAVKAGQQITGLKSGLGKVTSFNESKIDQWYNSYPPDPTLLPQSVKNMAKADRYAISCGVTLNKATTKGKLTAEEQKQYKAYSKRANPYPETIYMFLWSQKKKLELEERLGPYGSVTDFNMKVSGDTCYYKLPVKGSVWKKFKDKNFTNNLFKQQKSSPIWSEINTAGLNFGSYTRDLGAQERSVRFTGQLTDKAAQSLIAGAFKSQGPSFQTSGGVSIDIRLRDRLWGGYYSWADFSTEHVTYPVERDCMITYGALNENQTDITLPKSAKNVNAKTGETEIVKALSSL